ncbi:hypothetical protein ACFE04_020700 [Oxalis oulophora]
MLPLLFLLLLLPSGLKLVKRIVEDVMVDISFNQIGGLRTLCFLQQYTGSSISATPGWRGSSRLFKEKKLEGIQDYDSWVLILRGEEMSVSRSPYPKGPQCLWVLGTKPAMSASPRLRKMIPKRPRKASFTVEDSSFKTSRVATIIIEESENLRVEVKTTEKEKATHVAAIHLAEVSTITALEVVQILSSPDVEAIN